LQREAVRICVRLFAFALVADPLGVLFSSLGPFSNWISNSMENRAGLIMKEILIMKRISIIAILALLAIAEQARPSIFTWDITPGNKDLLSIKLQNWEPSVPTVVGGGLLFGVGRVTTIEDLTTGNTAWAASKTQELTFTFQDYKYNAGASTPTSLFLDGGTLNLYYDTTPGTNGAIGNKKSGTNAVPDNPTDTQNFTGGTLQMQLVGNPGVVGGHTLNTAVTGPTSGTGRGFLDVVAGSGPLASFFDNNAFATDIGSFADFNLHTTLQPTGAPAGFYPIFSNDPIDTNFVAAVPEPISVAVWGGLLSLGGAFVAVRRSRRDR
jgi:hypothetical protein